MQHLRALARPRIRLAAILFAAGLLTIAWAWMSHTSTAPTTEASADQGVVEALAVTDDEPPADPTTPPAQPETVIVYISGAVRAPDVYQLPAEARVKDLVLAAGGLAPDADPERINLAERLKDGDHLHVLRRGEAQPGAEVEGGSPETATEQGQQLNINTASSADLDGLPGIGQALAQRIDEYRTANGPFKSVEDLRNVKGIGPALFAKIAPLVTVGP